MAGHLLSTLNPDAASNFGGNEASPEPIGVRESYAAEPRAPVAPQIHDVPMVGEPIRYYTRGWRSGRQVFPAVVTKAHPETGNVDLVAIFDADDFIGQKNVPRRGEDGAGWERVTQAPSTSVVTVNRAHAHDKILEGGIDELRAELAGLREVLLQQQNLIDQFTTDIYGEYVKTEEPILGVLVEFDGRLTKLETKSDPVAMAAVLKQLASKPRGRPRKIVNDLPKSPTGD